MCGSTDLMKQDGVFVCQSCGTKYSVEEAKKMMVEGTVDVSGSTVKVDTSNELANLYQIARRAKDDNNHENAAKYYDMILLKDPTNWEAAFYVVYFKAMGCKIAQIHSAAISVNNCENSVLTLIRDHVPKAEQSAAVSEIVSRSIHIATMLSNGAENHYYGTDSSIRSNYIPEYIDNICAASNILYTCGSQIELLFREQKDIAPYAASAWKAAIHIQTAILQNLFILDKARTQETVATYVEKIGKYDPTYAKEYAKSQLETEIASLKKTIANTPIDRPWTWKKPEVIFMGVLSTLFMLVGIIVSGYRFLSILGVILFAGFIWLAHPDLSEATIKKNRKTVHDAKEKLAKKEAELNHLMSSAQL